jgi:hypothetical protein
MKPGCQKLLIGCIAVPCILLVLLAISVVVFRMQGAPEHRIEAANLEQPVAALTSGQLAAEGLTPGQGGPPAGVVSVRITLTEGFFTIKPGPPGSSIRVEGNYDAGSYDLLQKSDTSNPAAPSYELSYTPKYSWLRRIFTEGGVRIDEDDMEPLVIWLPAGLPMDLNTKISMGKSEVDLGGLALHGLSLDLSMGDHKFTMPQPNAMEMPEATLRGRMGDMRLSDLGNLRASSIDIWGRMGEMRLDTGPITKDTKITSHFRMGALRISVPKNVRTKLASSVFLGDAHGPHDDDPNQPETGPLLDIQSQSTMGEIRVTRY